MPIQCQHKLTPISQDEFHKVDYGVMKIVFDIHNEFGRLYNEKIYQEELAHRCIRGGFDSVLTEVPIQVSFKDFIKMYYLDLVINNSLIYELKAVDSIIGRHQNQAINYLLLTGLNYGKIINFKPNSVKYRFVSTTITPRDRYKYEIDESSWENLSKDSAWLKKMMCELTAEWGLSLDIRLFCDAIIYFRGGEKNVLRNIEIKSESKTLGKQRVYLLNEGISFNISAIRGPLSYYESNLRKFIRNTSLDAIQWINMGRNRILYKTIKQK